MPHPAYGQNQADSLILSVKVTRISADRKIVRFLESNTVAEFDEEKRRNIVTEYIRPCRWHRELAYEEACFKDRPYLHFRARKFHRLHPFFPSSRFSIPIHPQRRFRRRVDGARLPPGAHEAFVLFFFSIKLIALARRVKEERMYAVGGIGFIAAEENFDPAAKSQRIE